MNTRHKGNIAVAHAIAHFSANGYAVFLPVGDAGGAIDIVVSPDGRQVQRVQCKYTTRRHLAALRRYPDAPIWEVTVARHSPAEHKSQAIYQESSFDLLFVSTPEGNYLIDWQAYCATQKGVPMTVRIGKKMSQWKINP